MALTQIKTTGIADNAVTDAKVADNITAGAASTAATLATARNINGVSFNGSSAITVTAAAGTLTGATLASGVTASSLTSVGTLTGLTIENGTNPLVVGSGTKDLYFDPDSNGVMVSTATSQGGDGHYYNDASGEVWTTIDGTAKVKVKASAFEVTPNATFAGTIIQGDLQINTPSSNISQIKHNNGSGALNLLGDQVNIKDKDDNTIASFNDGGNTSFTGDVTLLGASSYARDLTFAHGATNYYWRMGYTDTSNGNTLAFINRDGSSEQEVMRMDWNKLTTFAGDVLFNGVVQLADVAQSIDFIQSGAINFDSNGDQTGRVLTIGSNRTGDSGGTTNVTFAEDGNTTFAGTIYSQMSSTSDYGNEAFRTKDGNNHDGIRIQHGGGNGKILLYSANSHRGTITANVHTAHTNGLTIGSTANEACDIVTNGTSNIRMRVSNDGNVGINETNPSSAKLVIKTSADGARCADFLHADSTVTSADEIMRLRFSADDVATGGRFIAFEDSQARMGDIGAANGTNVSYTVGASDKNLKKNFEDWNENVLEDFKNLKPQKFNYKRQEDTDEKLKGYIAQDLKDAFPEAYPLSKVKEEDEWKDYYFFNPSGMVVYLMKAVQELSAKVDALEGS